MVSTLKQGQIAYGKGSAVRVANFDAEDVLWLCRAVEAEGRVEEQVAQVLVNLWARTHSKAPGTKLVTIVRAYAQPVNPRWYLWGDLHKKWVELDPKNETAAKALRREQLHSRMIDFRPEVVAAVNKALTVGSVDIPACATDYAAPRIDASGKYGPALTDRDADRKAGRNTLWTRDRAWLGYRGA